MNESALISSPVTVDKDLSYVMEIGFSGGSYFTKKICDDFEKHQFNDYALSPFVRFGIENQCGSNHFISIALKQLIFTKTQDENYLLEMLHDNRGFNRFLSVSYFNEIKKIPFVFRNKFDHSEILSTKLHLGGFVGVDLFEDDGKVFPNPCFGIIYNIYVLTKYVNFRFGVLTDLSYFTPSLKYFRISDDTILDSSTLVRSKYLLSNSLFSFTIGCYLAS